ncbi:MAG: flavodoxin family protein [Clostridia bacterium]|nr:flavodoxin family protein [Clostridia bacterium]
MKILVINGSPKGDRSNTLNVTRSFLAGVERALSEKGQEDITIDITNIYEKNIFPCRGCFACWNSPEGGCVIKDDYCDIRDRLIEADMVIASFPLYFFGMPSGMKAFTDRTVSLMKPYSGSSVRSDVGKSYHKFKYDFSKKQFVIISTCGYADSSDVYTSLRAELDLIFGFKNYFPIFCPQGELFGFEQLKKHTDRYLASVQDAGYEFATSGEVSEKTKNKTERSIIPQNAFEMICNARWGSAEKVSNEQ